MISNDASYFNSGIPTTARIGDSVKTFRMKNLVNLKMHNSICPSYGVTGFKKDNILYGICSSCGKHLERYDPVVRTLTTQMRFKD